MHLFAWRMIPSVIMRTLYKYIRKYTAQNVLFASGACLMMRRRDFVAIGGYDPKYFLTIEDTCDLCIRLCRKSGDRVVIEPRARMTHFKSRSAAAVPFVTMWNGARGSIYHFKKHHGSAAGLAAYVIVFLSTAVRIVAALPMAIIFQGARTRLRNGWRVLTFLVKDNPLRI
jgi:GT2 family glycosyltransferase